jgi:hypothetical protein
MSKVETAGQVALSCSDIYNMVTVELSGKVTDGLGRNRINIQLKEDHKLTHLRQVKYLMLLLGLDMFPQAMFHGQTLAIPRRVFPIRMEGAIKSQVK